MALLKGPGNSRQYNHRGSAAEIAGTQSGRKRLAVHARQLALKQNIQILQRHRRPLMLCMEPTHRPALEDHVNRTARLGAPMILFGNWYKLNYQMQQLISAASMRRVDLYLVTG